ncbi:MAG: hypothetical protein IJV86_03365 [Clostridia bacterium]|nr:hypothetical protein [Clostridia bacterium]
MKKRNKPVQEKKTVRERLANTLDASKEVILDAARLTFIGNRELMVENYKSIGEYTEKKIILETNPHRLVIDGAELEIRSMAKELIYITGQIQCVTFRREV